MHAITTLPSLPLQERLPTAMLNRLTQSLDFQSQALLLRSERQRVIASNIANADTPGYKAREMDFSSALRQATGLGGGVVMTGLSAPRAGHLSTGVSGGSGAAGAAMQYATPSQTNLDQNSVDMDRERASFADNAVQYEATLRFINGSVKTLLSAITGQ